MATSKKTAPAKKTTPATKTSGKKSTRVVQIQSFRRYDETVPFMTFQFTIQSLYWAILSVLVLALGAWVLYLNIKIQDIYDQVEMNTQLSQEIIMPAETQKAPVVE